jgi:hypothetical protein
MFSLAASAPRPACASGIEICMESIPTIRADVTLGATPADDKFHHSYFSLQLLDFHKTST